MQLQIISPVYKESIAVAWFEIETPAGNFVIQKGHAPTVLTLLPEQEIAYRLENGQQKTMKTKGGIVKITRESALLLLDE